MKYTRATIYKLWITGFLLLFAGQAGAQVTFIENKGQWETTVKYRADIPGGLLFVENGKLSYLLIDPVPFKEMHDKHKYDKPVQMHYYRVIFEGSNPNVKYATEQTSPTYFNFYLGNDPKKWATGVSGHYKIIAKDLYKGIDLEIYGSSEHSIKYNLIIKPGANPADIKMRYEGLDDMRISGGELHLSTSLGEVHEKMPVCYQIADTTVNYVKTDYNLKNNLLTFDIKEKYNRRKSFVIDPEVVFSTYSGALGDNWGFTGTWDHVGNGYSGGASYFYPGSNGSFPVTPGAFQTTFKNGVSGRDEDLARDAAIYKVSADGSVLMYATYLGGRNNEEPHSMIVNSKGELIVFGTTFSNDFPVSSSGFDPTFNGVSDIFVFVLSADGKSMIGSTFIGGSGIDGLNGDANPGGNILAYNYGDQYRGEVIIDNADNIYVATSTQSISGFPVKNAFQSSLAGRQDGCVFKLNPTASTLIWGSYLGGAGDDVCNGIDLDSKGNVLVAGGTTNGITGVTAGMGESTTIAGGIADGFLLKISPLGNTILNATYVGTNAYDQAYFVKVDKFDNPYVTGQTEGAWPISTPIFSQNGGGQFICKFTEDLKIRTRSMVYGQGTKAPQISLSAFLVDECERVFVSGWGGAVNSTGQGGHGGSTSQMTITPDAFQKTTDGSDFYVAVFSKNLDELTYATFLGGRTGTTEFGGDHVDGGTSRFDKRGIVYQSVCAGCGGNSRFPTTPGAYSRTNNSNNCNNALFKLDFENLNKPPVVNDVFYSVVATNTLSFTYTGTDADKYDTLFLTVNTGQFANPAFPGNKPHITYPGKGLQQMQLNFSWTPGCEHVTGDTIVMKVYLQDAGCPDARIDSAEIKILVLPPPLIDPPGVLCLLPNGTGSMKLVWHDVDTANQYFSHFMLLRTNPAGQTQTLGPFTKTDVFEYIDNNAPDYRNVNYCYSMYSVNICGKKGKDSYIICSSEQFNSPIKITEVITATVEENKNVKVVWRNTQEDDFDSYLVYRSPKPETSPGGHGDNYEFYKEIKNAADTFLIDNSVNVKKDAYCYRVQVTDKCGHISRFSNRGCNIVLRGISEPYIHRLDWDTYNDWQVGVDNYELIRKDDRQVYATTYQGTPAVLNYDDEKLDFDWGAYWYTIIAHESAGNNATSQSNEVLLIQKPLLHVPTAFTPTGDGLNETWGQVDVFVKEYHMQVFNRWGQKVFESFDKNEQWNGSFANVGPADNVFIWLVRYTGWDASIHIQRGTVTILN